MNLGEFVNLVVNLEFGEFGGEFGAGNLGQGICREFGREFGVKSFQAVEKLNFSEAIIRST